MSKRSQTHSFTTRAFVKRALWFVCLMVLVAPMLACQLISAEPVIPSTAVYLISGLIESNGFVNNGALIFDPTDYSQIKRFRLPHSSIRVAEFAPDGNLWIGLSGYIGWDDDRIMVYDPGGRKLVSTHACLYPANGIWFYKDKAYIVCDDNGFIATVAKVNTKTFKVEQTLTIDLGEASFLAESSVLSGHYLAMTGLSEGDIESLSHSILAILDLDTGKISGVIKLGAGTDIWTILPYRGDLYILNSQGGHNPEKTDIMIVSPEENRIVDKVSLETHSPLWGVISNDTLYSYQNGNWNAIFDSPERSICETDLTDYSQVCVPLRDNFTATDMELINGLPCVAHWGSEENEAGLYCLEDGKFELKLASPDASLIVVKK